MNKLLYVFGIALLLGATLLWFMRDKPATNYPSEGTHIIAFGDSLVEGVGASQGRDFVSLLSHKIGEPIINFGVSGDTTASGLARLNELNRYNPKVVILLLGGNDYLRRVPPEETFANLSAIIEDLHRRGAVVLLLGVRGGLLKDNFEAQYKALHKKYNTAYVPDVLDGLIGNSSYMADQIHPNNAGHARIAERVYPVLIHLLE